MNRTQPIDYKSVLSLFLPAGILDYFDITEASNMGDYFMLVLVEKDIVPENLHDLLLISNYCCPLKVFVRYKIRAGFLAWNSALLVTFVFAKYRVSRFLVGISI